MTPFFDLVNEFLISGKAVGIFREVYKTGWQPLPSVFMMGSPRFCRLPTLAHEHSGITSFVPLLSPQTRLTSGLQSQRLFTPNAPHTVVVVALIAAGCEACTAFPFRFVCTHGMRKSKRASTRDPLSIRHIANAIRLIIQLGRGLSLPRWLRAGRSGRLWCWLFSFLRRGDGGNLLAGPVW